VTVDANRVFLAGVDPSLVQHPLDRSAMASLKRVRGFEFFLSKFVDAGVERMDYQLNAASSVRVGPRQLPSVYGHLRSACAVLGVPEPELYVCSGGLDWGLTIIGTETGLRSWDSESRHDLIARGSLSEPSTRLGGTTSASTTKSVSDTASRTASTTHRQYHSS